MSFVKLYVFVLTQGWFGLDCDKKCENGTVIMNNLGGECECDPCYNGDRCQLECSDNGKCDNGTCDCYRQPRKYETTLRNRNC